LKPALDKNLKEYGFVGINGTAWVLRAYITLFELRILTPSTKIDQSMQDLIDLVQGFWRLDKADIHKAAKQYGTVVSRTDFKFIVIQKIGSTRISSLNSA